MGALDPKQPLARYMAHESERCDTCFGCSFRSWIVVPRRPSIFYKKRRNSSRGRVTD